MNIESITIQNFRNIGEAKTFKLNKHFTAFIGVNGKGKSTILHALRIASGAYFLAIPDVKSRHIQKDEIRVDETGRILHEIYPVKIEAKGYFPGSDTPIVWRRQWLEGSSSSTTKNSDVGAIKAIANKSYQKINIEREEKVPLPIIAYFGISRAVGAGRVSEKSRPGLGKKIFHDGYQDWEEMRTSKFHYREWLARYDTLLVHHKKEYPGTKDAFFKALTLANPYISYVEFQDRELWIKVDIEGNTSNILPLDLHSDGIHYFTEMVAEIAYRCVILNGYLGEKTVEETKGIVMIDEIDFLLHPTWQRHVVDDLKTAFPNIQFVVTTHSPFIVQSLKSDEVWNLDKIMDVNPDELKIDTVATEIMGVASPYSGTSEELYQKSKEFMEDLETNKSNEDLDKDLEDIPDPAVRAFLELQKIAKGK